MSEKFAVKNNVKDRELSITRILNAPRSLVWKVFTEPQHLKAWWGPEGFTSTIHRMEVKENGRWNLTMHGPDGMDYPNEIVYVEIVKPEKIVFEHINGPRHRTTILLEARHQKTILHFSMLFETPEEKELTIKTYKADIGLQQTIHRLEVFLEKLSPDKELSITRIIHAPRELVFKAWTDKNLLAKWWGPSGFSNPVCEWDPVPDGKMYIEMKAPDGTVYPMDGYFKEIIKPEKIVFISGALDEQGQRIFEVLNTVTFTEQDDSTKLVLHALVIKMSKDAVKYIGGMDEGWLQSLIRLEALLLNA